MKTAAFFQRLNYVLDLIPPGPGFVGLLRERARRSPARGFQRLQAPLGGRPKADHAAGSFARRSAKADCAARSSPRRSAKADRAARTSSRRSAKADYPARSSPRRSAKADRAARSLPRRSAKADRAARTSSRRSAKADHGGRLCPGGAFPATRPAGTARFLITRGKASFYETATFGRRKSFFVRRFVACFFARPERNWRCRRGKSPPPRNPGRPAAARPTTATGSRFSRRQRERPPRRPRPSPPAREGSLGAPNDRTFPPGAERKARKEKGKEKPRMKRAPPL